MQSHRYFLGAAFACALVFAGTGTAQAQMQVRADFNNDGFEDLAIGAPGETINGVSGAGAVHVLLGTPNGLTGAASQFWHQSIPTVAGSSGQENDHFGAALAAGDFNADGFADLAVGAPGEDLFFSGSNHVNTGQVHVFYGTSNGLTDNITIHDDQFFDRNTPGLGSLFSNVFFGEVLATGDFNHDGFADLAIGMPHEVAGGTAGGGVIVLRGTAAGLTHVGRTYLTEDILSGGTGVSAKGENFGWSLAAGDFDHDSFDDLAIGVPGEAVNGATRSGAVFVSYGTLQGLSTGQFIQQQYLGGSNIAFDNFASSLASGDFNNDGFADLAIGTPNKPFPSVILSANAGRVYVLYGSSTRLSLASTQIFHQPALAANNFFGSALAAADFNQDGADDLAIGVPGQSSAAGAVVVMSGSATGLSSAFASTFTQNNLFGAGQSEVNDNFGASLGVGDYNGDGSADLAAAAQTEDFPGAGDAGEVNVIYGSFAGLSPAHTQRWNQIVIPGLFLPSANDRFGASLSARPVNAHGLTVVGMPQTPPQ